MMDGLYTELMAQGPGDPFDRHVLASAIASGFAPPDVLLTDTLALSLTDLRFLLARLFPHALSLLDVHPSWRGPQADADEEPALRALLHDNRSRDSDPDMVRWLARLIARRSLGHRHLWEDLGLTSRAELGRLMAQHFRPLSDSNPGMRWKKYFYRTLCEQDGVLLCKAPNCAVCEDYALCFVEGENLVAATLGTSASVVTPASGPGRGPVGGHTGLA
ncbi:nitrogen fixation protein NifQ [Roseospira visakhapatnamensis]|uniref:Nitrogen fixation protein NifQ n=1 Tax=Roseospira visakhapatnamensis TaxID=390880 RepID=A0A7W6RGE1_9PROT|nr:nitrogen fixation protein NifQ [Roseospira visakhapatnamensis]MBB4268089.1 nitrogen fixation protein NifQ [Roseospira visakhapatnamensis]